MKYAEAVFEVAYLVFAIAAGIALLRRRKEKPACFLSGLACLVLGLGDAFHLVPRVMRAFMPGADLTAALGFGTAVTSITMTVFYVLLDLYRRDHFGVQGEKGIWKYIIGLAAIRIVLCCFPENDWFSGQGPLLWGIIRNIPFVAIGTLAVLLWRQYGPKDAVYKRLWLAVILSFLFYLPVVLFAHVHPMIGMLMLPKTVMYVWMMCMFLRAAKASDNG